MLSFPAMGKSAKVADHTIGPAMFRLSIGHKVFLTVFLVSLALTAGTLALVRVSIAQGFEHYLARLDEGRLDRVARLLVESYREQGNWSFLPMTAPEFSHWLRRSLFRRERGGFPRGGFHPPPPHGHGPDDRHGDRPPPSPWPGDSGTSGEEPEDGLPPHSSPDPLLSEPHLFARRLTVLDGGGRPVAGSARVDPAAERRALNLDGKPIGILALNPMDISLAVPELRFLARQRENLGLIGLGMLALSGLGALVLARNLVAPIRQLVRGANRLAQGDFGTRIEAMRGDEFGELARDFNRLAQTLAQNEASRRQWIADTSHELRTPIAVLRSHIEAMQDGVRQNDARMLDILHGEVMSLSALVDDLHQLARADAGAEALRFSEVDVASLLDDVVASFAGRYTERKLALDWQPPEGACPVRGDAERLRRVFGNLLENSLRYTDSGGRLRIVCERRADTVALRFEDTAPGVPESALPRLFERFFRVEISRSRRHGGSGLGLAICKALVEAHGGGITATASELGGLRIDLTLPIQKRNPS
jgi:two-component system sensor histidine kinase BaeS